MLSAYERGRQCPSLLTLFKLLAVLLLAGVRPARRAKTGCDISWPRAALPRRVAPGYSRLFPFAVQERFSDIDMLIREWVNGRGEAVRLLDTQKMEASAAAQICSEAKRPLSGQHSKPTPL